MLCRALLTTLVLAATAVTGASAQSEVAEASKSIDLLPVPWEQGEFLTYDVRHPNGKVLGMLYLWTEAVEGDEESQRLWMQVRGMRCRVMLARPRLSGSRPWPVPGKGCQTWERVRNR